VDDGCIFIMYLIVLRLEGTFMMVIFLFHSFYNLLCMDRFPFGTDLMTLYEEMNLFLCTVRLVKLVVGITVIIF